MCPNGTFVPVDALMIHTADKAKAHIGKGCLAMGDFTDLKKKALTKTKASKKQNQNEI